MATRHRTFSFPSHDIDAMVGEMASFGQDADGRRWLNIIPDADETEIHTGSSAWRIFSSRGPMIPQLTWFPAHQHRDQHRPAQVGVAHATGRGAVERLGQNRVGVPSGWSVVQDHQKRGIIFVLEDDAGLTPIVEFAVSALRLLSPFRFEDSFLATFSQQ